MFGGGFLRLGGDIGGLEAIFGSFGSVSRVCVGRARMVACLSEVQPLRSSSPFPFFSTIVFKNGPVSPGCLMVERKDPWKWGRYPSNPGLIN